MELVEKTVKPLLVIKNQKLNEAYAIEKHSDIIYDKAILAKWKKIIDLEYDNEFKHIRDFMIKCIIDWKFGYENKEHNGQIGTQKKDLVSKRKKILMPRSRSLIDG